MLDLICYLLAVILGALAALAPGSMTLDRFRLFAAAFVCFTLPFLVHAAERM